MTGGELPGPGDAGRPDAPTPAPADTAPAGAPAATDEPGADAGDHTEPGTDIDADAGEDEPVLPEPVRQRVVALSAAALGGLPVDQVPAPLRRFARFAPNRRAKLASRPLAAQLAADPAFRRRIATGVLGEAGELAGTVAAGGQPGAADPVEVAALAYLIRPAGWRTLVAATTEEVRARETSDAAAERLALAERRAADADHARSAAQAEVEKLRAEMTEQRTALSELRAEVRTLARSLRDAEKRERRAVEALSTERGRAAKAATEHEAESRRLRARLADAESAAAASKSSAKEGRAVDEARLWLLLETITGAARGLSRELALDPVERTPADFLTDGAGTPEGGQGPARALPADDPARLDRLVTLPAAHLVVDGYNVTKTGYGDLSLEQQRNRLVSALAVLAAQTGAEVTCVFDGADRVHGIPTPPRGVRVLFSHKGETADELIRRLVRAEPAGRPVIVISSDREVADGVHRHGAYPLPAHTLLRRLARA